METVKPHRVQLKRTKGWKMPPNTVKVDRSTRWGNPWRIGKPRPEGGRYPCCETAAECVEAFRRSVDWDPDKPSYLPTEDGVLEISGGYSDEIHQNRRSIRKYLRGKNLACWCPLPKPGEPDICHAAVLLEIANA